MLLAQRKILSEETPPPSSEPEPAPAHKEPVRKTVSDAVESPPQAPPPPKVVRPASVSDLPRPPPVTSPLMRPSSVSEVPSNAGLAGRFSGEDLVAGRAKLRQNSQEEQGMSMRFNANGSKKSILKKSHSSSSSSGSFSIGSAYQGVSLSYAAQNDFGRGAPSPPPTPSTKNNNVAKKPRPVSNFESQLDPREELMISIRNTGGMAGLRKVSLNLVLPKFCLLLWLIVYYLLSCYRFQSVRLIGNTPNIGLTPSIVSISDSDIISLRQCMVLLKQYCSQALKKYLLQET